MLPLLLALLLAPPSPAGEARHAPPPGQDSSSSDEPSGQAEPGEGQPETLPAEPAAPPPPAVEHAPPPPAPALPTREALERYRREHLELRSHAYARPVHWFLLGTSWGGGGPGYSWEVSTTVPVPAPLPPGFTYSVFRGRQNLAVPDFLELVGQEERARALQLRIRRNRQVSNAMLVAAGASVAAVFVGVVGAENAPCYACYQDWSAVATAGVLGAVAGLLGHDIASYRANELRWDYRETLEFDEVRQAVEDYDARLRDELGLTPEQAARALERPPPPPPPRRFYP